MRLAVYDRHSQVTETPLWEALDEGATSRGLTAERHGGSRSHFTRLAGPATGYPRRCPVSASRSRPRCMRPNAPSSSSPWRSDARHHRRRGPRRRDARRRRPADPAPAVPDRGGHRTRNPTSAPTSPRGTGRSTSPATATAPGCPGPGGHGHWRPGSPTPGAVQPVSPCSREGGWAWSTRRGSPVPAAQAVAWLAEVYGAEKWSSEPPSCRTSGWPEARSGSGTTLLVANLCMPPMVTVIAPANRTGPSTSSRTRADGDSRIS